MSTRPITELGVTNPQAVGLMKLAAWSSFVDIGEDVPELRWPHSVGTYKKMSNDVTIEAMLFGLIGPLRRYTWLLNPNGAKEQSVRELADDLGVRVVGDQEDQPRRRTKDRFN